MTTVVLSTTIIFLMNASIISLVSRSGVITSAVLFMDRTFTVRHEVISTKVFKNFLEAKDRGRFFDIEYEMYGFMDEIEIASCTYNTVKKDTPFWYGNQRFRELIEMVFEKDPKGKAEALVVAEEHEKNTANLDTHF